MRQTLKLGPAGIATLLLAQAVVGGAAKNVDYVRAARDVVSGACESAPHVLERAADARGDLTASLRLECAGKSEVSIAVLRRIAPTDSRYRRARLRMGFLLERKGTVEEAARAWLPVAGRDAVVKHLVLAAIAGENKEPRVAEARLQAAVALDPDDCWSRDRLLVLLLRERRWDEATRIADGRTASCRSNAPFCAGLAVRVGTVFVRGARWSEAVAVLENALRGNPSDPDTRDLLAAALIGERRYLDAVAVLNQQIAKGWGGYSTYVSLATASERLGRTADAKRADERASQLLDASGQRER